MNALDELIFPSVGRAFSGEPQNALMMALAARRGGAPMGAPMGSNALAPVAQASAPMSQPAGLPPARSEYADMFSALEQQYGLPAGYLDRLAAVESGYRSDLVHPRSRAAGMFQFIPSTARAYGLTDPTDVRASAEAAARLARDNARLRDFLGRDPTARELYLAHQQGAGGARGLLSRPDALAVDVVGRPAVVQNAGRADMTAREFAEHVMRFYETHNLDLRP